MDNYGLLAEKLMNLLKNVPHLLSRNRNLKSSTLVLAAIFKFKGSSL